MIKKLRLKFVLINMMIVMIMLGFIFGMLYFSTSRNLERESMQMMRNIAINPMSLFFPNDMKKDVRLPYFSVMTNPEGERMEVGGGFFDLSDEKLLDSIIETTNASPMKSGVLREYNLRYMKIENPMGEVTVFADITSEKATLRNMMKTFVLIGGTAFLAFLGISVLLSYWAIKPVENAWQQQKQFVADASHELKTPLTVITTDAELLNAVDCPEEDRVKLSGSIIAMSGQMRGLVESLLELARIDSGSVREQNGKISLSDIFSEASMMFEPVFFENERVFFYDVAPDVSMYGNGRQMKQLADILLDNAMKYSSFGGETKLLLKHTSTKKCQLVVSNRGEEISSEDLKHLFKRFYRADKTRSMNHSYGLGLSIAESITKEHKGRIWAESKDGFNSFYVELPILTSNMQSS